MVSIEAIVSGSSAALILVTGYATAIGSFIRARKMQNKFLIWAGIFLICMGSFYLGTVTSFINLLITGYNIDTNIAGWLCYTIAPIGAATSMYVGFTTIKPKLAKWVTLIYALSAIPFWYFFYFDTGNNLTSNLLKGEILPGSGELIDLELMGIVEYFTIFYLGSFFLILVPSYIWLARNSSGIMKKKAILQSVGYTIFVICGALDSIITMGPIIMIIVRICMASAYILLFLGFTLS